MSKEKMKTLQQVLTKLHEQLDLSDDSSCAVFKSCFYKAEDAEVIEELRQAMKLYLDTWVRPALVKSVAYLQGEVHARQLERFTDRR